MTRDERDWSVAKHLTLSMCSKEKWHHQRKIKSSHSFEKYYIWSRFWTVQHPILHISGISCRALFSGFGTLFSDFGTLFSCWCFIFQFWYLIFLYRYFIFRSWIFPLVSVFISSNTFAVKVQHQNQTTNCTQSLALSIFLGHI